MYYVSDLIGKPVSDQEGRRIGKLKDLLARQVGKKPHPMIVAIEIKKGGESVFVSIRDVAVLIAPAIPLNKSESKLTPYLVKPNDFFLIRDVLDKQIIDTNGVRVVRVNDLALTRVENDFFVAIVDVSGSGLLRRTGLGHLRLLTEKINEEALPKGMISWQDVELISGDQPMRLKVPGDKLTELHPADLAEILSDLSRPDGSRFLETLDIKTVADTLEEVEPDFQASLISHLSDDRLADLLEEMAPDEAADLLAELPENRSKDLLELMEDEDADDVRKLLTYPENTAGGIMNTEFVAVRPDFTAEQAIKHLRQTADEAETVFYVYVTTEDEQLVGVFSLLELVLAKPTKLVSEFMEKRVVAVKLSDSQDDCAHVVSKYNLIAVPVIDEAKRLHGIVTVDDALDQIIPTAWKKRLPRFFH